MKQAGKHKVFLQTIAVLMATVPLCALAQKGERIILSLPNLSEQRYVTQQSAAQDEAKVQGFDLQVKNSENDTLKQLADINLAIAQKVDAIVIHPNDETALAPAIDRAVSAGIPIVTIDKDVKGAQKLIPYIGVNYLTGGIEIARYITNRFPNGAHIFFISGQPGNSITNDVGNGLRKGLGAASNIYKIVAQETKEATNFEAGFNAMANFLETYQKRPPEVVLAANEELAAGSSAALNEFGVPKGNVTLIDLGDNKAFDKIADGTLSATVNFLPKKASHRELLTNWGSYQICPCLSIRTPKKPQRLRPSRL
jgi:inositol transport system substrate-binding protein